MNLSVSRVDVRTSDGTEHTNVVVLVRNGQARMMQGRTEVATMPDVASVTRDGARAWLVTGAGGATWSVSRKACAPCGQR